MKNKLFLVKFTADSLEHVIGVIATDGGQACCDILNHFNSIGVSADRISFSTINETPVMYRQQFQPIAS